MHPNAFTLEYYRDALKAALSEGYRFVGFPEAKSAAAGHSPVCILRHDCDNDLVAALRLAEMEAEFEISATYFVMLRSVMYNALSLTSTRLLEKIVALGHRIALHFDESRVASLSDTEVNEEIEYECGVFEHYFGVQPEVISFHQPSRRVLTNQLKIKRLNTYDRNDVRDFDYISDSSGVMRIDLLKLFSTQHFRRLHLNLHPEWWQPRAATVLERWQAMLISSAMQQQEELWERENSFPQISSVTLNPIGEYRELPERMVYSKISL